MAENIFHQAHELLKTKNGQKLTEEEGKLLSTALIPLLALPQYNDVPISKGLEELAELVEEAKGQD